MKKTIAERITNQEKVISELQSRISSAITPLGKSSAEKALKIAKSKLEMMKVMATITDDEANAEKLEKAKKREEKKFAALTASIHKAEEKLKAKYAKLGVTIEVKTLTTK